MTTLSLCLIVKNEEENIERCLASVQGVADEMIVVDTGSTDRTVELAAAFGTKIFYHAWQADFAQARNVGLAQATGDWILHLDADEELEAGGRLRLKAVLDQAKVEGLLMVVRSLLPPGPGVAYDDALQVRLFRNRLAHRYEGQIHEQIMPSILQAGGKLGITDLQVLHYGYMKTLAQATVNRDQRNIALLEQALAQAPQSAFLCAKLGLQYRAAGNVVLAETYLQRVLSLDYHTLAVSQFQDVLLVLGQIAFDRQDYALALDCVADCLARLDHGSRAGDAMSLLADIHLRLGQQALESLFVNVAGAEIEAAHLVPVRQHFEQAQAQLNVLLDRAELNSEGFSSVQARLARCAVMLQVVSAPKPAAPPPLTAAARLQSLLAADDLPTELQAQPGWLDEDLLALVRTNAELARRQEEPELAEGLETLAAYIRGHLAGVYTEKAEA